MRGSARRRHNAAARACCSTVRQLAAATCVDRDTATRAPQCVRITVLSYGRDAAAGAGRRRCDEFATKFIYDSRSYRKGRLFQTLCLNSGGRIHVRVGHCCVTLSWRHPVSNVTKFRSDHRRCIDVPTIDRTTLKRSFSVCDNNTGSCEHNTGSQFTATTKPNFPKHASPKKYSFCGTK